MCPQRTLSVEITFSQFCDFTKLHFPNIPGWGEPPEPEPSPQLEFVQPSARLTLPGGNSLGDTGTIPGLGTEK